MTDKKMASGIKRPMSPRKIGLIVSILFFVGFILIYLLKIRKEPTDFYQDVAVYILISWLAILIIYYSWAIGFYNINFGWTDEDWKHWYERRKIDPTAKDDAPTRNPHSAETLGLPNGTIRGTIAVSLLVLGVAMMVASLTFNNTYPPTESFIDNFKFFKDAFLLMIAFYFGNKSLEFLKNRQDSKPPEEPAPVASSQPYPAQTAVTDENLTASAGTIYEQNETVEASTVAESTAPDFKDPKSLG